MEMYWEGPRYADRHEAGLVLAEKLACYRAAHVVVLAIPNGGVVVGLPIARKLDCPLHLLVVRKLQIPDRPEAGFGSVVCDGSVILNQPLVQRLNLSSEVIETQRQRALESIRERLALYGRQAQFPDVKDRTVILVDDGLASGYTMEAAVKVVKKHDPSLVVVAVPTSSMSAYRLLSSRVDKVVCPDVSRLPVFAVADAYRDWRDLEDEEVIALLENQAPMMWK
jgi:predicted phosphoribosyltransferase